MRRTFTEAELESRHKTISTVGICPDCETPLGTPKDMGWPHEVCPSCDAHYLADSHSGYRRLIQSFPIPGRINRDMFIDVL